MIYKYVRYNTLPCVCALHMTYVEHIEQIKLKSSLINLPPVSPTMTTTCNNQPPFCEFLILAEHSLCCINTSNRLPTIN